MKFSWNYLRKMFFSGTSLVVQWLRLHIFTAGSTGSIPGGRTKIPHATRHGQKKKFPFKKLKKVCLSNFRDFLLLLF